MKCKETKNNIVVFDTDFLITNTKSITDIIKKISTKYVCYVPQICIDEFCAKKYNDALEKIRKFKNDLKSYEKLGISFGMSESECEKMIKEETSVTLKKMFSNNIICFHDYPLIKIVNRAYAKKPPFEESDKGLKDTLILLNIIDFIKGKNITNLKFITNDTDFLRENVKESIINEVKENTNCILEIIDGKNAIGKLYNYLKIEEEENNNTLENTNINLSNLNDLRQKINDICNEIFYYPVEYGYQTYYKSTFKIFKKFHKPEVEEFISNIPIVLNNNIFSQFLKMSDFFNNDTFFKEESKIDITNFEELFKVYTSIKDNNQHEQAFINFLVEKFNENYKSEFDDLPF